MLAHSNEHFNNGPLEDNYLEPSMRLLNLARYRHFLYKHSGQLLTEVLAVPTGPPRQCTSQTKAGTQSDWPIAVSAQVCSAQKTKNRYLEGNFASETNMSLENVRSEHWDIRK